MKPKQMWAIVNRSGYLVMNDSTERQPLLFTTRKSAVYGLAYGESVIPVIISERPRKKAAK